MNILLINPPNSGRSIPEERFGIDSVKQILRGEPMALEALAGNLIDDHDVRILDLKADLDGLAGALRSFSPDLVGLTGVTCEANAVLALARQLKAETGATVVAGGIHASNDPEYFNRPEIDYVAIGLAKAGFRELADNLERGGQPPAIDGIAKTTPGQPLRYQSRRFGPADLVDHKPPAYHLVADYRDTYKVAKLNLEMGFVATAYGCPFSCSFCCISALTGGKYLTHSIDSIIRDIRLLGDIPVIRLLDANTFANPDHARRLCDRLEEAGIRKQYLADVRSDTVVNHPELMRRWKAAGLRAVIIGFEEISDAGLDAFGKANSVAVNSTAIEILHDIGITIIGDFIVSPDYTDADFDRLARYINEHRVDLPMITVLTPLPGTRLYREMRHKITIDDLDYYTLTNAVVPTRLDEQHFYERYAALLREGHAAARV